MGHAVLLWAGFQESGQDDPRGSFYFCAFIGHVNVWAELKKSILETKLKSPWLFASHRSGCLLVCSQNFPEFKVFRARLCEGRCARSLVVRSWWGDRDLPTQHMGQDTAIWQWPGSPWLPQHQWVALLRAKRQRGQMSCFCKLRGWGFRKVNGLYVTKSTGKRLHTVACSN